MCVLDSDGTIISLSRGPNGSSATPLAGIEGMNLAGFLPLDVAHRVEDHLRSASESGGPVSFEETLDGHLCENVVIPLPSTNGDGARLALVSTDVTESRRSREVVEDLNRCLLGLTADPRSNIWHLVDEGRRMLDGTAMKYVRPLSQEAPLYSPAFDLDRAGPRAVFNHPDEEDSHCEGCPMLDEPVVVSCDGGRVTQARCAETWFSGLGPGYFIASPVLARRRLVGCLCFAGPPGDTHRTRTEEIIGILAQSIAVQEERLDHEREIRDFMSIASHELRHPITIIKGYTGTLENYGERLDDETKAEILRDIDRGADRLTKLVSELLDTSRIAREGLTLSYKEAGIPALVNRAVALVRQKTPGHTFDVRTAADLEVRSVDSILLVKAIYQLLDNAVNFSPVGTGIEVEAVEGDGATRIRVLDRGIGIPEAHRGHIFDRFYRVGEVLSHSVPGIGLGLYIARNIVEEHGGTVTFSPREGGGSIFEIAIP